MSLTKFLASLNETSTTPLDLPLLHIPYFFFTTFPIFYQDTFCDPEPAPWVSILCVLHISLWKCSVLVFIMPFHTGLESRESAVGKWIERTAHKYTGMHRNATKPSIYSHLSKARSIIRIAQLLFQFYHSSLSVRGEKHYGEQKSCKVPGAAACKTGCLITYCLIWGPTGNPSLPCFHHPSEDGKDEAHTHMFIMKTPFAKITLGRIPTFIFL